MLTGGSPYPAISSQRPSAPFRLPYHSRTANKEKKHFRICYLHHRYTLFVHCEMLSPSSWPAFVSSSVFWTLVVFIWVSFVPCAAHDHWPTPLPTVAPKPTTGQRMEWTLHRRTSPPARTVEEWGKWCVAHAERMKVKYGDGEKTKEKRGQGTNLYGSSPNGSFEC